MPCLGEKRRQDLQSVGKIEGARPPGCCPFPSHLEAGTGALNLAT